MNFRIFLILIMIGLGIPVFLMSSDKKQDLYDVKIKLTELQKLDAAVNELVMRSRIGLDRNYDRLAETSTKIERLQTTLAQHELLSNDQNTNFASDYYNSYLEADKNKGAVVENFKSHNSVLRNSLRYAPMAASMLIDSAERAELKDEANMLRKVRSSLLEYNITGSRYTKSGLVNRIPQIKELEAEFPKNDVNTLLNFIRHVEVIIEEKNITDTYMEKAINSRTDYHLESTIDQVGIALRHTAKEVNSYNNIITIYITAVGLILLIIAYTLRKQKQ